MGNQVVAGKESGTPSPDPSLGFGQNRGSSRQITRFASVLDRVNPHLGEPKLRLPRPAGGRDSRTLTRLLAKPNDGSGLAATNHGVLCREITTAVPRHSADNRKHRGMSLLSWIDDVRGMRGGRNHGRTISQSEPSEAAGASTTCASTHAATRSTQRGTADSAENTIRHPTELSWGRI